MPFHFRHIDDREHLPGDHRVAYVRFELFQETGNLCVQLRLMKGPNCSRLRRCHFQSRHLWRDGLHGGWIGPGQGLNDQKDCTERDRQLDLTRKFGS